MYSQPFINEENIKLNNHFFNLSIIEIVDIDSMITNNRLEYFLIKNKISGLLLKTSS